MNQIETSCYTKYNMKLRLANNIVFFDKIPSGHAFDKLQVSLGDMSGKCLNHKIICRTDSLPCYILPEKSDGLYCLNIFAQMKGGYQYWSYASKFDIVIKSAKRVWSLVESPVYSDNLKILNTLKTNRLYLTKCLAPSSQCQSDHPFIIKLANKIIQQSEDKYLNSLMIHDWVASNLFYDYDGLSKGNITWTGTSALNVMMSRKSICEGYSNLSVALLRAIGIPATRLPCYTLDKMSNDKWWTAKEIIRPSNHIITAAYVNGRWILMDVTWDSDNKISNGKALMTIGHGRYHKYFDVALPFLSNTHHLGKTE